MRMPVRSLVLPGRSARLSDASAPVMQAQQEPRIKRPGPALFHVAANCLHGDRSFVRVSMPTRELEN